MAKKKIEADAVYRVELAKKVFVGRRAIMPNPDKELWPCLRGDVIERVIAEDPDAIKSYEPAPEVGA